MRERERERTTRKECELRQPVAALCIAEGAVPLSPLKLSLASSLLLSLLLSLSLSFSPSLAAREKERKVPYNLEPSSPPPPHVAHREGRPPLHGYLTRKKHPPPRTLQQDYRNLGSYGGPRGGANSCEQVTVTSPSSSLICQIGAGFFFLRTLSKLVQGSYQIHSEPGSRSLADLYEDYTKRNPERTAECSKIYLHEFN